MLVHCTSSAVTDDQQRRPQTFIYNPVSTLAEESLFPRHRAEWPTSNCRLPCSAAAVALQGAAEEEQNTAMHNAQLSLDSPYTHACRGLLLAVFKHLSAMPPMRVISVSAAEGS